VYVEKAQHAVLFIMILGVLGTGMPIFFSLN
jgi:hypothetical protein